jgi:protein transport protein SEC61 subunit alpha
MVKKEQDTPYLLKLMTPSFGIIPEVPDSGNKVSIRNRTIWLVLILVIYLSFSQMKLVGLGVLGADPFELLRPVLASRRGTLMELGISPLITATMFLQVLARLRLFHVNLSIP